MPDKWLGRRLIAATRLVRDEMRVTAAFNAVLDRHKVSAMTAVRSQVLTASVPPDAFDISTWDTEIDDDVAPTILAVFNDQAGATLDFLKLTPEQRAKALGRIDVDAMADTFIERIKGVGAVTADRLRDALTQGIGKGESIDKLAARVDGAFLYGRSNAYTIARTETHGAAEITNIAAARATGFALVKTWLATNDERTRDDHADADGQVVGIDEPFDVGGEELDFPGDPDGSADNVINCRCTATFELPDGGEAEVESEE